MDSKSKQNLSLVRSRVGRLGALRRYSLYGNPGTPEGRRLGGLTSILRRRLAGQKDNLDRFRVAKPILEPAQSPILAEFIGLMLGDGCINSPFQASFYFNAYTDVLYADFAEGKLRELFNISARRVVKEGTGEGCFIISSKRFVEFLMRLGMPKGDKVRVQASVPNWICEQGQYKQSCLRGLMDTDGSVYSYSHQVYGKQYTHAALCFSNRSFPLLEFVEKTLSERGYRPVIGRYQIYLHRQAEVKRYFSEIGTHNPKFLERYHRRGVRVVEGAVLEKR